MRRGLLVLLVSMVCGATAMAQGFGGPTFAYSTNSTMAVDPHGNLLIFDTTYTISGILSGIVEGVAQGTVTGPVSLPPIRQSFTPSTKVTVIPGGTGKPTSTTYAGTFEIVGTGKWALYAIATVYPTATTNTSLVQVPRKLVAIDAGPAGTSLPTDISGFLNTAVNNGEVKLNASTGSAPDTLYNLQNGLLILPPISATGTSTPVARVERTITFDGTRFTSTDISLP